MPPQLLLLHQSPQWSAPLLAYCRTHWPKVADDLFRRDLEASLTPAPLPVTGLLLLEGQLSGFYQLTAQEPLARKDLAPWLGLVHVREDLRGRGLCGLLLGHALQETGGRGFSTLYLATDHIGLYERYGWREIGLTLMDWGTPTKLYEHTIG